VAAVVIVFGVSFKELSNLQGPLASLNVASHVMYRVARVRSGISLFAFETDPAAMVQLHHNVEAELALLEREYETLMYGGKVVTLVSAACAFQDLSI
jgi:hypothetical protein